MPSIFEKTMSACLESKRVESKKQVSKGKRMVSPKKITEKKKVFEELEDEELPDSYEADPELDGEMPDVESDIVVVVDPDLSEDEFTQAAADAQEIVDETPEGEIPMDDEHIGDKTYTCPICGNTFFSEEDMTDGDECPVCSEVPTAFVLRGEVQAAEEAPEKEEEEEPEEAEEQEDLDPSVPEEDLEYSDVEESKKVSRKPMARREARRVPVKTPVKKVVERSLYLDEKTFNPFLNRFITENYKNSKSMQVVGAKLRGRKLTIECKIIFRSGTTKNISMVAEGFRGTGKFILRANEANNYFKHESKTAKRKPFLFKVSMDKNVLKCEGLKYDIITKNIKEKKTLQIYGSLIVENKNSNKRSFGPTRKSESAVGDKIYPLETPSSEEYFAGERPYAQFYGEYADIFVYPSEFDRKKYMIQVDVTINGKHRTYISEDYGLGVALQFARSVAIDSKKVSVEEFDQMLAINYELANEEDSNYYENKNSNKRDFRKGK